MAARKRLEEERNIWLATTRSDGRPHLVPVWFVWKRGHFYLCIEGGSVKARNIRSQNRVSLSLEDGSVPVICEGEATPVPEPWPAEVTRAFTKKYDWAISPRDQYDLLIRVRPMRWLGW
jgi:PPOX class probable F420-dependent enzyme